MRWIELPIALIVFYGALFYFGKHLRDWRDAQEYKQLLETYFQQTTATCNGCAKPNSHCDCDAQTNKHRDDQQTTD